MRSKYTEQINAIQPIISETDDGNEWLNWFVSSDRATQEEFSQYIITQGLGGHWHQLLSKSSEALRKYGKILSLLERYMSAQQTVYYNQISVLGKLDKLLEHAEIPYAVIKGAHIREVLYAPPALRPCEDIDILINPEDKFRVTKTLIENGFRAQPDIKTIAHDLVFAHGAVAVDVHWDILRPGRTQHPLTKFFLSTRLRQNGYFSLTPESTLFIMLVHPVFKKYLTTPYAYLSRIIDLHEWLSCHSLDWQRILHLCDKTGLKTAAWLTATYYGLLTKQSLNEDFVDYLKPSKIKAAYFSFWLKNNLSSLHMGVPFIPKLFFTLVAHDTINNSLRFLVKDRTLKKQSLNDLQNFQKLVGI